MSDSIKYNKLYRLIVVSVFLFGLFDVLHAQIVTNGGFENSDTGIVNSVKGWVIQVADTVKSRPVFEIVSDTVEQGNRALKVTVHGLGVNQWDIQAIAESLQVMPGARLTIILFGRKAQMPVRPLISLLWSQARRRICEQYAQLLSRRNGSNTRCSLLSPILPDTSEGLFTSTEAWIPGMLFGSIIYRSWTRMQARDL